jgi:hypothetical protein
MSIQPSQTTPEVLFLENGIMKMNGRSYPENAAQFFEPIISAVSAYEGDVITIDFNLEYFNTASSKKINELLKYVDANNKVNSIVVNWHYEEGDDDSVETAEIFEESLLRCDFRYFEHPEVA